MPSPPGIVTVSRCWKPCWNVRQAAWGRPDRPCGDWSKGCPMKKAPQRGLFHGRCNVMRCADDAFAQPQWLRQAVASETPASACITWRCRFRRGRSGLCEQLLRLGRARQRGRRWIGMWQRASQRVPCCAFWLLPRPLRGLRRGCVGFRTGWQIAKHRLHQRGRPTRRKRQQQRRIGSVRSCS